ncbi:MAG: DEAD/DEAH box helicase [Pseudomonadota bacterium]
MSSALAPFHPLIAAWFREEVGRPTRAQRLAWPAIAAGEHLLLTAPTGSGKTLAAFLWALNQLASGAWPPGSTRVVYVSPLRALNNDIRRNLLAPLTALHARFVAAGLPWPHVQVLTRSSDTPGSERQRMVRRPPAILVTTPESLNLLVSSAGGQRMLGGVAQVILDEIHAVVGSKRGTHLITAVERLTLLSGEVQRVALSATVRPVEEVARFVGGYRPGPDGEPAARRVTVHQAEDPRRYALTVHSPRDDRPVPEGADPSAIFWRRLADRLGPGLEAARSTLIFANNRRTTEKLVRFLNEDRPEPLAWAHHGSLARELRLAVEARLKAGELKAIVATNSLELGIDVGALERVLLVQTPPNVASTLQRLGRAGHRVGEVSEGELHPLAGRDLLDAAVVARAAMEGDLEPVHAVRAPLDVLAQIVLAMTGSQAWPVEDLYAFLRRTAPYRELPRRHFDLVLDMLAGRYGHERLRELQPALVFDRVAGTVQARPGARRLVYLSGGTIPDRGYYALRHAESKARIGELDEEFVWERSLGDTFTLGSQTWRILRITHNDVEVAPAGPEVAPSIVPFWRAEARDRPFHLAERVGAFLGRAEARLEEPTFQAELIREHHLTPAAAEELLSFLRRQREHTGAPLPHRHHLLVEHFADPLNSAGSKQVILHTTWGGAVNHPLALCLAAAWQRRFGERLQVFHDDHGVLLLLPDHFGTEDLLGLLELGSPEELLRGHLATTGLFGAVFREAAARALLLPRQSLQRRQPLWLNRLRGKKLLEHVGRHPDFPIVLEAWREILQDSFDLPALARVLEQVQSGEIAVSACVTRAASPFCDGLTWRATNTYMYESDAPEPGSGPGLRPDLLEEIVHTPALRPRVPAAVAEALAQRLARTAPGYAPGSVVELVEHVKERLLVPQPEWQALLAAIGRDTEADPAPLLAEAAPRLARLAGGVCARERLPLLAEALGRADAHDLDGTPLAIPAGPDALPEGAEEASLELLIAQWLQTTGPVEPSALAAAFELAPAVLDAALTPLLERREAVLGPLLREHERALLCDARNLAILLRMARAAARPALEPLPLEAFPLLLAQHHGLTRPGHDVEGLQRALEQLFGYPARAEAWESWIFPARLQPYHPAWLEGLAQDSGLGWLGCGSKRVTFCFPDQLELFPPPEEPPASPLDPLLESRSGFDFSEAQAATGLPSADLSEALWGAVWAGRLRNSTVAVLRRGVEQGFEAAPPPATGRAGFSRWKVGRPLGGRWEVVHPAPPARDPVEEMERARDRVRQLLERQPILFRALLQRELPALRWGAIFRALRLMELSGEVVGGLFVAGLPGPQFTSHPALRALREPLPEGVWFHNAADPASACGLSLPGLDLPARRPTTWLAWRGHQLALVAEADGRRLDVRLPPDHPDLGACLAVLKLLCDRRVRPAARVEVEQINDEPAPKSPYAEPLLRWGFQREFRSLVLRAAL